MSHAFLWQTVLILVAVKLAGQASRALGQPSVLGKLLVGVILGPAILGSVHLPEGLQWMVLQQNDFIKEIAEIGVILLMFIAGLETDLQEFRKSFGSAFLVALIGVVVPFIGGFAIAWQSPHDLSTWTAIFLGVLLVATSVSISVQTLRELGQLKSKEGITILGAAVIDDVLGLIVLSFTLGLAEAGTAGGFSIASMGVLLAKILVFLVGAAVLGVYVLPPLMRAFAKFQVGAPQTALAIAIALGFGFAAEAFGVAAIVGSYLVGMVLGATGFGHALIHDIETVTFSFFAPFFFVNVGLAAKFGDTDASFWIFAGLVTFIAVITKIIGCGIGARLSGFNNHSSISIGCGMVARGEVGLIVANIGLAKGIIDTTIYTTMIAVVVVTTLVTPPLLKMAFRAKLSAAPSEGV